MEKTTSNAILKIAVLGAESTGKSTLCEGLAKHYQTVWVPEYARIFFNTNDINQYSIDDLAYIATQQLILEEQQLVLANRLLFCDTTLVTIKIWAQHCFNTIPEIVTRLLNNSDYDLYLICNNDVVWKADEQRKDKDLREYFFKLNEDELKKKQVNYHIIKGIDDQKLIQSIQLIDDWYKKYTH